jgi:hypothetical protein
MNHHVLLFCYLEPAPPGLPVNLTEGSTLVQGNHVTVSVQWKHPTNSDIPVSKYKVIYYILFIKSFDLKLNQVVLCH